jgi:NAD-dependent SIR2 family protein deacetylase
MRTTNKKTVFVLGAGFSKADDIPLQYELLKNILTLFPNKIQVQPNFIELSINGAEQKVMDYYDEFEKCRQLLADFLVDNFTSFEKKAEYYSIKTSSRVDMPLMDEYLKRAYKIASEVNVTLEDLFTIFDKVILGHEHFQLYSVDSIVTIHKALRVCIIFLLSHQCAQIRTQVNTISKLFSKKIFDMRVVSSRFDDVLSIITMNWDSLLEKELFQLCQDYNSNNHRIKIYPDLCFYDDSYNKNNKRPVSTQVKAKGYRNIKLLKLHGSINWLNCPYCGRIYVDYEEDIALNELALDCSCPKCKESSMSGKSPQMHSTLITPTFLKDLNDLHLKNIWHNALIDLIEADKIIFIGYSFPDADFEMRCLLKKAVQPNTNIEVVLHHSDNPEYYKNRLEKHKFNTNDKHALLERLNLPERRYNAFFGDKAIIFHYDGIEGYIQQEMENEP